MDEAVVVAGGGFTERVSGAGAGGFGVAGVAGVPVCEAYSVCAVLMSSAESDVAIL